MWDEMRKDEAWEELAQLDDASRQRAMGDRFRTLLELDEETRQEQLTAMIRAEYGLPDAQLRPFTVSRLRVWIELAGEAPESTRELGEGYDRVFATLPAQIAMRRAMTVQTTVVQHFTPVETDRLFEIIPGLVRQLPRQGHPLRSPAAAAPKVEAGSPPSKGFWSRILPHRPAS